jgi:hypothetical protein
MFTGGAYAYSRRSSRSLTTFSYRTKTVSRHREPVPFNPANFLKTLRIL